MLLPKNPRQRESHLCDSSQCWLHFGIYRQWNSLKVLYPSTTEITVPTTQRDSDYKATLVEVKATALGWAAFLISLTHRAELKVGKSLTPAAELSQNQWDSCRTSNSPAVQVAVKRCLWLQGTRVPQQALCLCSLQIIPGFTAKGRQFSGTTGYVQCSSNVWQWDTAIRHDSASAPCSLPGPTRTRLSLGTTELEAVHSLSPQISIFHCKKLLKSAELLEFIQWCSSSGKTEVQGRYLMHTHQHKTLIYLKRGNQIIIFFWSLYMMPNFFLWLLNYLPTQEIRTLCCINWHIRELMYCK